MCDWHSLNCVWVMSKLESDRVMLVKFIELIQKNRSLNCHERWVDARVLQYECERHRVLLLFRDSNFANDCHYIVSADESTEVEISRVAESELSRSRVTIKGDCSNSIGVCDSVRVCDQAPCRDRRKHWSLVIRSIVSDGVLLVDHN